MKKFLTIFLAAASLGGCVDAMTLPTRPNEEGVKLQTHVKDWRDEVIYQLITDRFHNGDWNNDYNVNKSSPSQYHGGDWRGIIEKLDYLQDLGVTAVWISPVVKNIEEDAGFASYHGYWTQDFLKHNPHFGSLSDLRRLSDELHKRGMKLIIDIVVNHVGQVFYYDINRNGKVDEFLSGSGHAMPGSENPGLSPLARITEYDPDFSATGIKSFTSMGISGTAPTIFFDDPANNRVAPGPRNIDLDGNGKIDNETERLGFANPAWYHALGRVYDWENPCKKVLKPKINPADPDEYVCGPEREHSMTHRFHDADGNALSYIDGKERTYYQNDQTLLGDFPGGLKDIATEREDVRKALIQVMSYWIDVTDCDGFRIDTLKHVEYSFWEEFAPAIRKHAAKRGKKNFLLLGEAFDGREELLAAYSKENQVDSIFLFSQKYAIDQVFKCPVGNKVDYCKKKMPGEQANPTGALYGWKDGAERKSRIGHYNDKPQPDGVIDENGNGLSPQQVLVNFLDNHDVARFLFDRGDDNGVRILKNALSFIFTTAGIPCVYYGTEQGFKGGNDPSNREDMYNRNASIFAPDPKYQAWSRDNELFAHIKKLSKLRTAYEPLRRGDLTKKWHADDPAAPDATIYAYSRKINGKAALVVINTHEEKDVPVKGSLGDGLMEVPEFPANTALVNALDPSLKATVNANRKLLLTMPKSTTAVFIPEADYNAISSSL